MPKPFRYTRKKSLKGGKNINMGIVNGIAANRKLFSLVANRTLKNQPVTARNIMKERKNALNIIKEEKAETNDEISEKMNRLHGALMNQSNTIPNANMPKYLNNLKTIYRRERERANTENKIKRVTLNKTTKYKLRKLNNNSKNASVKAANLLNKKFMNLL